jgi:hypothetical protein
LQRYDILPAGSQILAHVKETNPDNLYWEIGNFWKFMTGGFQEKKWPGL